MQRFITLIIVLASAVGLSFLSPPKPSPASPTSVEVVTPSVTTPVETPVHVPSAPSAPTQQPVSISTTKTPLPRHAVSSCDLQGNCADSMSGYGLAPRLVGRRQSRQFRPIQRLFGR